MLGYSLGGRGSGWVVVDPGAWLWIRFAALACRKTVVGFTGLAHTHIRGCQAPAVTSWTHILSSPATDRVFLHLGSPRFVALLHAFCSVGQLRIDVRVWLWTMCVVGCCSRELVACVRGCVLGGPGLPRSVCGFTKAPVGVFNPRLASVAPFANRDGLSVRAKSGRIGWSSNKPLVGNMRGLCNGASVAVAGAAIGLADGPFSMSATVPGRGTCDIHRRNSSSHPPIFGANMCTPTAVSGNYRLRALHRSRFVTTCYAAGGVCNIGICCCCRLPLGSSSSSNTWQCRIHGVQVFRRRPPSLWSPA